VFTFGDPRLRAWPKLVINPLRILVIGGQMDWYSIFKFLHVASAVCWVGGGVILMYQGLLAGRAKDVDAQIRQIGGNLEPARSRKTDDRGTRGKSALGAMSRRTRSPNP